MVYVCLDFVFCIFGVSELVSVCMFYFEVYLYLLTFVDAVLNIWVDAVCAFVDF